MNSEIDVRIKISALWASVMFCYIYADYFGLYVPGALQRMLNGSFNRTLALVMRRTRAWTRR